MGVQERVWVYDTIRLAQPVIDIFGDRIKEGESLPASFEVKPFVIYRMGNVSPDNRVRQAKRQYFTVYVHDEAHPGDYLKIDEGMQAIMDAFEAAPSAPEFHILEARWLENSSDQDDREMGTILRYARFQLIQSSWT